LFEVQFSTLVYKEYLDEDGKSPYMSNKFED
jgi:hypothetical protein